MLGLLLSARTFVWILLSALVFSLPASFFADDFEPASKPAKPPVYVKPSKTEVAVGSTMGAYQTAAASTMWLSSDIPLSAAAAIALGMGARTWVKAVYLQTYDNLVRFPKSDGTPNSFKELAARQGENLLFLELWRLMSGPVGQAPSALTLTGQLDLLAFLGLVGTAGSFAAGSRNAVLTPRAKMWMAFNGFMVGAALRAAEQAGVRGPELLDLNFFKISTTLGVMVGFEVASGLLVRKFPAFFEKATEIQEKVTGKIGETCRRGFGAIAGSMGFGRSPQSGI